MGSSVNDCTFIGRLGKDPEVKTSHSGKSFATFSIAIDKGKGEEKTTMWLNITAFNKNAEFATKYLVKGSMVYLRGELVVREYTDKDGVKRTSHGITANWVQSLQRPADAPPLATTTAGQAGDTPELTDEDIPF